MTDFFKFETVKEDIPFYNGEPKLSIVAWAILLLGLLLYFLMIRDIIYIENGIDFAIASTLVLLVPFLFAFRGHYSRFFKRLHKRDIKPIILYTLAGLIYSLAIALLFESVGLKAIGIEEMVPGILIFIRMLIQLLGEELYKVIILIIVMYLIYKISNDRKRTIIFASIITMIIFGGCHQGEAGSLIRVIAVQGFGSIFDILIYLKTKNVAASYATHLLFDIFPEIFGFLGTFLP